MTENRIRPWSAPAWSRLRLHFLQVLLIPGIKHKTDWRAALISQWKKTSNFPVKCSETTVRTSCCSAAAPSSNSSKRSLCCWVKGSAEPHEELQLIALHSARPLLSHHIIRIWSQELSLSYPPVFLHFKQGLTRRTFLSPHVLHETHLSFLCRLS